MKKLLSYGISFSLLLLAMQSGLATEVNNVTINYSINVKPSTCEVHTSNVDIIFKDAIGANMLASLGTFTSWNSGYSIELTGCEPGAKIEMWMAGATDKDVQFYKNEGTAENIMVELSGDDRNISYQNGSVQVFQLASQESNLSIPLKARLLNNGFGPATPGTVKAVVTATFSYP
ncbi:fimbrial protein [Enterobacteriaceae bacterium Kacie_13]|nr:fimbrial protein [Enterobacteriaceae bacterium Kacie_13]